jgi:hypothetical protein
MSHVVYPEGDGFVVAEVWRMESDGLPYLDGVLRPLLTAVGLAGEETTVRPVWSFARPGDCGTGRRSAATAHRHDRSAAGADAMPAY